MTSAHLTTLMPLLCRQLVPPAGAAAEPSTTTKLPRAKGAKERIQQTLDVRLVFWCAMCNDPKPKQSLKSIASHRKGSKRSCARRFGARDAAINQQAADGFLFFSEPPPPPPAGGNRGGRGMVGRGGRGARGGGRSGGPGRGRKSEATKAAEKAKLAAFLAAKYGSTSKLGARSEWP